MTKRLVDIDDAELKAAQESGDFSTIKETVAAGLRELAAVQARRREIERIGSHFYAEFSRSDAWR